MEQIPKQVQDKLAQFQGLQNQLQLMAMQKQQLMLQTTDVDNALAELEKITKEKVYKVAGPLLIETNKKDSSKDLKEKKETVKARIALLEKQEKKLSGKLEELGKELQSMLKTPEAPKAG